MKPFWKVHIVVCDPFRKAIILVKWIWLCCCADSATKKDQFRLNFLLLELNFKVSGLCRGLYCALRSSLTTQSFNFISLNIFMTQKYAILRPFTLFSPPPYKCLQKYSFHTKGQILMNTKKLIRIGCLGRFLCKNIRRFLVNFKVSSAHKN